MRDTDDLDPDTDAGAGADTGSDADAPPPAGADQPQRRVMTKDDYLVPGPTATSNEGLGRWGLSWLIFSVLLILLMLGISWVCWVLARATGIA